jgi:hypothetical protein
VLGALRYSTRLVGALPGWRGPSRHVPLPPRGGLGIHPRRVSSYAVFMPVVGDPAPEFTLPDQDERQVRLSDLRGSWVVLWWYPKASTGG